MTISLEIIVIGAITGMAYAVLASGLILIYRVSGVIHMGHGETGALAAALAAATMVRWHVPFMPGLLMSIAIGAAIGMLVELLIVRRLAKSSKLIVLVATIGVGQLLFFLQFVLPDPNAYTTYPTLFHGRWEIAGVTLRAEHIVLLVFGPLTMLAIHLLLSRTTLGRDMRASADNADAARLAGVNVRRTSTIVWGLAGAIAAISFALINPVRGTIVGLPSAALGPGLLVRALVPSLLGRFERFGLAIIGGVVFGVVEAIVLVNFDNPGTADLLVFLVVLVLVAVNARSFGGDEADKQLGTSSAGDSAALQARSTRRQWRLGPAFLVLAAIAAPVLLHRQSQMFLMSRVVIYVIIGLSIAVLTGWAGLVSLGQFALVGLGAMLTVALTRSGMPFAAAVFYATVGTTFLAVVIGIPASRVKGMYLAVVTLAFAVAARTFILTLHVFTNGDPVVFVPRGKWAFIDLHSQRTYYYVCLALAGMAALAVGRLRREGPGRSIVAVRDNASGAAAFGLSPSMVRLGAFAVSGGLAGLAGGLLAGLSVQFGADMFGADESLRVLAMAIIGGLGSVPGAVLGALWVLGLPIALDNVKGIEVLTSGVGLLILLLYVPGGLVQVANAVTRGIRLAVDKVGAGRRADPATTTVVDAPTPSADVGGAPAIVDVPVERVPLVVSPPVAVNGRGTGPVLVADEVTVHFGGLVAVDHVSIEVGAGEVVGLVGNNGSGKSTLVNAIAGSVPIVGGRIELFGRDLTDAPPEVRSAAGIGRIFQAAGLFSQLTVMETILVAIESHKAVDVLPAMFGLPSSIRLEREKRALADDIVSLLRLGRYVGTPLNALSTGTRRVVDLAALVARGPRLILADEPTAGLAQRETEAFVPLISQVASELGASMLIIEHDMPLITALSDRLYCMNAGKLIASGAPHDVIRSDVVVAAYLGTDERAIARSDSILDPIVPSNGKRRTRRTPLSVDAAAKPTGVLR